MEIKGIDVSSYQGSPNWAKVADSGVQFAILRITQKSGIDTSFEYNYKNCKANEIPIGVYRYSYALTTAQAQSEATAVVNALKGKILEYPVFLDLEFSGQRALSSDTLQEIVLAFRKIIVDNGYQFGIYCNVDWYNNVIPKTIINGGYDFWIARYPASDNGTVKESLRPSFGMGWQYSSKGSVPGISGNVDMDVFYKDYASASTGFAAAADSATTNTASNSVIKYTFDVGTVKKGSIGSDVKLLQRLLKSNGCKGADGKALTIDGQCGTNTVYATKIYQKRKNLTQDGIAGTSTWKSILLR